MGKAQEHLGLYAQGLDEAKKLDPDRAPSAQELAEKYGLSSREPLKMLSLHQGLAAGLLIRLAKVLEGEND